MSAEQKTGGWWPFGRKSAQAPRQEPTIPRVNAQQAVTVSGEVTEEMMRRALSAGNMDPRTGKLVNERTALGVAACWAAIRIISGAASNTPLMVKERNDDDSFTVADRSYLHNLINRRPNTFQTAWKWKRHLYMAVMLRGNAYYLITRGTNGKATSLWPIPSYAMEVEQDDAGRVIYKYTRKDGRRVTLQQKDILHYWAASLDGLNGVTPLTYARTVFAESLAMQEHNASVYGRGAKVSGLLTTEKRLGPEGRKNLKESMDEYREGGAGEGKEMVLEDGLRYERMAMTQQDMEFVAARKASSREIFMLYGVPPHLAGDTESNTALGAGIEAQTHGFEAFSLADYLTMVEDGINNHLLPQDSAFSVMHDRRAIHRASLSDLTKYVIDTVQFGVLNPNEGRKVLGENPRDGGEEFYPPPNQNGSEDGSDVDAGNEGVQE